MPLSTNLPTTLAPGDPAHTTGHNTTNTRVNTIAAAVNTTLSPEVYQRFDLAANGFPTVPDRGAAWSLHGGSVGSTARPTVVSGKLTKAGGVGAPAAGYATVAAGNEVQRIGAKFVFSSYTTDNGSAVLIDWASDIAGTFPTVPDSACHLAIKPTGWVYGVWSGGSFTQVADGTFVTELTADGVSEYTCEVFLDRPNATAYLVLPDRSVVTVEHATIGTAGGGFPGWEYFQQDTTDTLVGFTQVWADSTVPALDLAAVRALTTIPVAPITAMYAPASNDDVVVPTGGLTDMDATNLSITYHHPAGFTKVKVELDAYVEMTGSTRVLWAFREGGTPFGGRSVIGQQWTGLVHYEHVRSGMTAGEKDFIFQHFALAADTATLKLDEPNGYYAVITVTPLP